MRLSRMKAIYRLFKRGSYYYSEHTTTGKQQSLKTSDRFEAERLISAKNEAANGSVLTLAIGKTYLAAVDPEALSRTWSAVMDILCRRGGTSTRERARRAVEGESLKVLRNKNILETTATDFLTILADGKSSTSHYLRLLQNLTIDLGWLPAGPVLARKCWPAVEREQRRAITLQEHVRIIEAATNAVSIPEAKSFLNTLRQRFPEESNQWPNLFQYDIWKRFLSPSVPKSFYFDDYYLLPGKINLAQLAAKVKHPQQQSEGDKTVLSLLEMAGITVHELTKAQGYEEAKAGLEGISNHITDKIFRYWTQNPDLQVEFDIRPDPKDVTPYDNGANLYVRIRNLRHRVTVPFSQRSKGFIWFFSFIIWFDTVRNRNPNTDLVLLLDEPGLSLHALAQRDLLRYIDDLSEKHQIIYTTHSPFMVRSDRLDQARVVEDQPEKGTVVTENLSGSTAKTVFPLQAALGYTIAQNMFIAERNLLVEGPGDLVYLRMLSNVLESSGKEGLRADVTIVPAGGLDKVATFVALLGANSLQIAVLHDYAGNADQRLESLVREKLIEQKRVITYAAFRDSGNATVRPTDVEDLFGVSEYLSFFNAAFAGKLTSAVNEGALPHGDRVVRRLEEHLEATNQKLRPSGGYNHYAVAHHCLTHPPSHFDPATLTRFEVLFQKLNTLFA